MHHPWEDKAEGKTKSTAASNVARIVARIHSLLAPSEFVFATMLYVYRLAIDGIVLVLQISILNGPGLAKAMQASTRYDLDMA